MQARVISFSSLSSAFDFVASWLILVVQLVFVIKLFFSVLGNIQLLRAAIGSRLPDRDKHDQEASELNEV